MRLAMSLMALAFSALAGTCRADSRVNAQDEDLFKWGEYDSLIRVLEPKTQGTAVGRTRADTLARAKSFLFLGVAFYATGKPERADEAFMRAVELDPHVRLDRFYVTEEIANHFQAIALDGFHNRNFAPARRARAESTAVAGSPQPPALPLSHAAAKPASGRKWVWLGLGITAAVTAGGGYYLFAGNDGEAEKITTIDVTGQ